MLMGPSGARSKPAESAGGSQGRDEKSPCPFPESFSGSMPGKAVRTSPRAERLRSLPDLPENRVGGAFSPGRLRAVSRFWGEKCWRWLPAGKAARSPNALPGECGGDVPAPSLPARGSTSTAQAGFRCPARMRGRGMPSCPLGSVHPRPVLPGLPRPAQTLTAGFIPHLPC